jgi:predicted AAA+ superfamily ATPase
MCPRRRVAVLDGTAHAPGQPWKQGKTTIRTLWGELAWQLGGADGFALVPKRTPAAPRRARTCCAQLLERFAPCVVLMDELVAYIRQFPEGHRAQRRHV